jgi:hypothetical protein
MVYIAIITTSVGVVLSGPSLRSMEYCIGINWSIHMNKIDRKIKKKLLKSIKKAEDNQQMSIALSNLQTFTHIVHMQRSVK